MESNTSKKIYGLTNSSSKTDFYEFCVMGVVWLVILLSVAFFIEDDVVNQVGESLCAVALCVLFCCLGLRNGQEVIVDGGGITITFRNFKTWTVHYTWEDYYHVRLEYDRKHTPGCYMDCMKIKRHPSEWLFSGTVTVLYTPMNYQLIKEWGRSDMTMDIPTEAFLDKYRKDDVVWHEDKTRRRDFYAFMVFGIGFFLAMLIVNYGNVKDMIVYGSLGALGALLMFFLALAECKRVVIDGSGVTITYLYFKTKTVYYTWENYPYITLRISGKSRSIPSCWIVCEKIRSAKKEWIYSGTVKVPYTPRNYELLQQWGMEDKYMQEPDADFLECYKERDLPWEKENENKIKKNLS